MANEMLTSNNTASNASKPLVFQSPPALNSSILPTEHAVIEGDAKTHARSLSSRAAVLAGTIGGALIGLVMIGAGKAQRGLKIAASAVGGGIVGFTISNLPWNAQKEAAEQLPEPPVAMPSIPRIPAPTPSPHPANPAASVANTQHTGRVDATAQTTELGA